MKYTHLLWFNNIKHSDIAIKFALVVESNFTKEEIEAAYKKGCYIIGFDLINTEPYKGSLTIPRSAARNLAELGCDLENFRTLDDRCVLLYQTDFLHVWQWIIFIGNPKCELKNISFSTINIGGLK